MEPNVKDNYKKLTSICYALITEQIEKVSSDIGSEKLGKIMARLVKMIPTIKTYTRRGVMPLPSQFGKC